MQVEHKWIEFEGGVTFDSRDTVAGMNELGKEGWRLCGKLHDLNTAGKKSKYGAFFYRELEPMSTGPHVRIATDGTKKQVTVFDGPEVFEQVWYNEELGEKEIKLLSTGVSPLLVKPNNIVKYVRHGV
jgi:hypothetical protein